MYDFGTLGGGASRADRITDVGQVPGIRETANDGSHAFVPPGIGGPGATMIDVGKPLGGMVSEARHKNAAGKLVGTSSLNGLIGRHAFIADGMANMIDLGAHRGGRKRGFGDRQ